MSRQRRGLGFSNKDRKQSESYERAGNKEPYAGGSYEDERTRSLNERQSEAYKKFKSDVESDVPDTNDDREIEDWRSKWQKRGRDDNLDDREIWRVIMSVSPKTSAQRWKEDNGY